MSVALMTGMRTHLAFLVLGSLFGCSRSGTAADAAAMTPQPEIVFMARPADAGPSGDTRVEVVVMNLDGSARREVTHNDRMEFLPHFSPDGSHLAYTIFTAGYYGSADAKTDVGIYDLASDAETALTSTGLDGSPLWSPDGKRIAFYHATDPAARPRLWIMDSDGSNAHDVAGPSGTADDYGWADSAWSSDDWILFTVVEEPTGPCFKTRLDKIRPDGTSRTQVSDGGPNCTPSHMEQSGDADPGFSSDGKTIYTSRGFPTAPTGAQPPTTERKLYALSSDEWFSGKPEIDLSLAAEPSCIEGVPKGSPDNTRVLAYRLCFDVPNYRQGIYVTDTAGSYRTFVVDGFGADWNPAAR
jgi:Tol biopolymer transport system component